MTQDEILKMARDAGFPFNKYGLLQGDEDGEFYADEILARFAALVAAKAAATEREACAQLVASKKEWPGKGFVSTLCPDTTDCIVAAIRARGGNV